MAQSKAGSILLLISGILTLVGALILLIIGLFLVPFGTEARIGAAIILIFFVVLVVAGILKIYSSQMMKDPRRTTNGGILALIVGVLSGIDILAIVGGILGIVEGGKK